MSFSKFCPRVSTGMGLSLQLVYCLGRWSLDRTIVSLVVEGLVPESRRVTFPRGGGGGYSLIWLIRTHAAGQDMDRVWFLASQS